MTTLGHGQNSHNIQFLSQGDKIYSTRIPNQGWQVVTISDIFHKVVVTISDIYCKFFNSKRQEAGVRLDVIQICNNTLYFTSHTLLHLSKFMPITIKSMGHAYNQINQGKENI